MQHTRLLSRNPWSRTWSSFPSSQLRPASRPQLPRSVYHKWWSFFSRSHEPGWWGKSCQEQRWAATWTWSRGDTDQYPDSYIRRCLAQEQTLFQMKDSHESAMHVNEDSVSRRLGATNKTFLYFIIATLVALLVFALATIMVLVIRRTVSNFHFTHCLFLFFWVFVSFFVCLFLILPSTLIQNLSYGWKVSLCPPLWMHTGIRGRERQNKERDERIFRKRNASSVG